MLPVLNQNIEGSKVSIYNEATHVKFPLLGLRLKNNSKQPLNQGPITVYEDEAPMPATRASSICSPMRNVCSATPWTRPWKSSRTSRAFPVPT